MLELYKESASLKIISYISEMIKELVIKGDVKSGYMIKEQSDQVKALKSQCYDLLDCINCTSPSSEIMIVIKELQNTIDYYQSINNKIEEKYTTLLSDVSVSLETAKSYLLGAKSDLINDILKHLVGLTIQLTNACYDLNSLQRSEIIKAEWLK